MKEQRTFIITEDESSDAFQLSMQREREVTELIEQCLKDLDFEIINTRIRQLYSALNFEYSLAEYSKLTLLSTLFYKMKCLEALKNKSYTKLKGFEFLAEESIWFEQFWNFLWPGHSDAEFSQVLYRAQKFRKETLDFQREFKTLNSKILNSTLLRE